MSAIFFFECVCAHAIQCIKAAHSFFLVGTTNFSPGPEAWEAVSNLDHPEGKSDTHEKAC